MLWAAEINSVTISGDPDKVTVSAGVNTITVSEIQRVDGRSVLGPPAVDAGEEETGGAETQEGIGSKITAHVQTRGDMPFVGVAWAGLVGQRLWIESFAIEPEAPLAKSDIEYKGLTATGFETPWLAGGSSCGTRGMGIPLIAFSVRIKPSRSAQYDSEYTGRFLSGATVGPVRNGAPCRSRVPDDPLEAIQLRILERRAPDEALTQSSAAKPEKSPAPSGRAAPATKSEPAAKDPDAKPPTSGPGRRAAKPSSAA